MVSSKMTDTNFTGKRILVTGAGSGIGKDVVKRLHSLGATVIALSKTQLNLDNLESELPDIEKVCVDLSEWIPTREAVKKCLPIDMVVNNAGISIIDSVLNTKPEDLMSIMNVNFMAVINVSQVVCKDLVEKKKKGVIVNISSVASKTPLIDHLGYCSSKAALDMVTRSFAKEMGPHGIRVNSINPTIVMTEMGKQAWADPIRRKQVLDLIPLNRFVTVSEVTDSVIFLLSDASAMVHGNFLAIDGGQIGC